MIYTVTLNPSIDYIMRLDDFQNGETNRAKVTELYAGGKGIMVSKLLHNLDVKSKNIGFLGGFTGEYIEKLLDDMRILHDFTKINGNNRINVKLKMDSEIEVNAPGPDISKGELEDFYEKLSGIDGGIVSFSGSVAANMDKDIYIEMIKKLSPNTRFTLDTTGDVLLKSLDYHPLLLKPNQAELEEIYGDKFNSKEEIISYIKSTMIPKAEYVICSLGSDGAIFVSENNSFYIPIVKGEVINSVGAGDSMVAGFIYAYLNEMSEEDMFKMAVASATATVFSYDMGEKDQINEIFGKLKIINMGENNGN
ncbi:1-phosphofructokinase [Finegoldia magna]|uniref:1-phosphofructokinase n=1 Tax=Finegoldia magna TaxID=1260 RepID=UPI00280637D5|nr:1-phosphofructokinase [Finegoldia magna]MDU4277692.1 1-phosphofructokinase [Finegoldia magna]MDU5070036.1 1-phosphofructokinase [Finegoldia magna]